MPKTKKPFKKLRKRSRNHGPGGSYTAREINLRQLGYETYRDYLESSLWKAIRRRVFLEKGRQCVLCERPATSIHHNRYDTPDLLGEVLDFMEPLCDSCHHGIEFDEVGRKNTVAQARAAFNAILNVVNGSTELEKMLGMSPPKFVRKDRKPQNQKRHSLANNPVQAKFMENPEFVALLDLQRTVFKREARRVLRSMDWPLESGMANAFAIYQRKKIMAARSRTSVRKKRLRKRKRLMKKFSSPASSAAPS